ncbi:ATP-binding protein [Palleronia caenipelagi]|uniref:histidine kinase n=1 Tax=Palleronia caenipelagi TaxID=2489174 RepID=A0A547PPR8_9RHOB|nr:ATP-binding protein [Palleronia caenipelagi]TRD16127.1 response regulator [Palleronia caenipelagi]
MMNAGKNCARCTAALAQASRIISSIEGEAITSEGMLSDTNTSFGSYHLCLSTTESFSPMKLVFHSPLARQYLVWTFLFGTVLTLVITIIEAAVQYSTRTQELEAELALIIEKYPENLSLALWQFNHRQVEFMLNYIIDGTSVSAARVETGTEEFSAGTLPSKNTIQYAGSIMFTSAGRTHELGKLYVDASLDPIYHEVLQLVIFRIAGNFVQSFLFVGFSLFVFHWLVNRHLQALRDRIDEGAIEDPKQPPFVIDRYSFMHTPGDDLDRLVSILNDARCRLIDRIGQLEAAYRDRDDLAQSNANMLKSISDTLHSLDQYVSVFDSTGVLTFATRSEGLDEPGITDLLAKPHKTLNSAVAACEEFDMICESAVEVPGTTTANQQQYRLELYSSTKRYWVIHGIVGADGAIGITAADITETKEIERRLSQSYRMEAMGKLTGEISHDFRNLLSIILGHAEIASTEDSAEAIREHHEAIHNASMRGIGLVDRLLAFASKAPLKRVRVDLNGLIENTQKWLLQTLPKNIETELTLERDLCDVTVDRTMMENALLNLIVNARDAMPQGGKLTITTRNWSATETEIAAKRLDIEPGDYVVMSVSDTGVGIPANILPRIFEPYFTTKGKSRGSGIGLAVVHGFAEQSGGAITVTSTVGSGTTFTLSLPAVVAEVENPVDSVTHEIPVDATRGKRILVVEDEIHLLEIMKRQLTLKGYLVDTAENGELAMEMLNRGLAPDVLMTDISMPGTVNGIQLARFSRKMAPSRGVVVLSGDAISLGQDRYDLHPQDILINKPVLMNNLLAAIEEAMKKSTTAA